MEESNMLQNYVGNIEFDWRECIFVIVNKDCGGSRRRRAGVAQLQLHSLARAATTDGD